MTPVPSERTPGTRTVWVRREPEGGERWIAGALALAAGAAVGGTVLYFARMLISREELHLDSIPEEGEGRG